MKIHLQSGKNTTGTYRTWQAMKTRCLNKNDKDYVRYGARGISIDKSWENSFAKFFEDMGNRPLHKTLDRIDNNGNYCKENCRWATVQQQSNNGRHNRLITHKGKTLSISQWASLNKIHINTLWHRIVTFKWSIEKSLTTLARKKRKHENN